MNIQKIFEGIAIVSGCALFIATSEDIITETPGPNDIPFQRITTNTPVGYQCPIGSGWGQQFHFTNLNADTQIIHIAIRNVTSTDTGLDTGLDEGEWDDDLASIELKGTRPSDRSPVIYPVLEDEIRASLGSSTDTVDFMLYPNLDEEVDIIVEGQHWDICFVLDLSEENQ